MRADEVGNYVLGGFNSFTTTWGNNMIEWMGDPFGTPSGTRFFTTLAVPAPVQRYLAQAGAPGSRARRTSSPYASTVPGLSGTFYVSSYGTAPYTVSGPQPTPVAAPVVTQRTLFNSQISFPNGGATLSNLQTFYVE